MAGFSADTVILWNTASGFVVKTVEVLEVDGLFGVFVDSKLGLVFVENRENEIRLLTLDGIAKANWTIPFKVDPVKAVSLLSISDDALQFRVESDTELYALKCKKTW